MRGHHQPLPEVCFHATFSIPKAGCQTLLIAQAGKLEDVSDSLIFQPFLPVHLILPLVPTPWFRLDH